MLVMWRGMEILAGAGIVILVREAHMVIHGERFVAVLASNHFL
jgi:hypothetical protein